MLHEMMAKLKELEAEVRGTATPVARQEEPQPGAEEASTEDSTAARPKKPARDLPTVQESKAKNKLWQGSAADKEETATTLPFSAGLDPAQVVNPGPGLQQARAAAAETTATPLRASTEYPAQGESLKQFLARCMQGYRGPPADVPAYVARMEEVFRIGTFQDGPDSNQDTQQQRRPRKGEPGYDPFPPLRPQAKSTTKGRGGDSDRGYIHPG